ncbi:hypothetical protein Tsp_12203, partial [Trichinella spiralis]|uniref:hypothetical protein n=1 Tax=Trichinella spiralis TaxID=6334 RepID=UPI0001EFBA26
ESSTCRFFYRKRQVSQLFLLFPNCKSKNEFDFFDVIYLYDEEYLRGLDTQYNVLHCLPIFLNVSIAVSHVPSAAPLLGLPQRQSNNEFHAVCYCNKLRAIGYVNRTVSMYLYFHDGSSTFHNRFQKVFQNSSISAVVRVNYTVSASYYQDVPKVVCQNSVSADSVHYGCGLHHSPTTMPMSLCVCLGKYVSQQSYMAYHRISICNRYGTRVLKVFQILNRNMAMQTATLRSTESNGKSTKGKVNALASVHALRDDVIQCTCTLQGCIRTLNVIC